MTGSGNCAMLTVSSRSWWRSQSAQWHLAVLFLEVGVSHSVQCNILCCWWENILHHLGCPKNLGAILRATGVWSKHCCTVQDRVRQKGLRMLRRAVCSETAFPRFTWETGQSRKILQELTLFARNIVNLEPNWPLFLKVNPSKQGLFKPKQGAPLGVPGTWIRCGIV